MRAEGIDRRSAIAALAGMLSLPGATSEAHAKDLAEVAAQFVKARELFAQGNAAHHIPLLRAQNAGEVIARSNKLLDAHENDLWKVWEHIQRHESSLPSPLKEKLREAARKSYVKKSGEKGGASDVAEEFSALSADIRWYISLLRSANTFLGRAAAGVVLTQSTLQKSLDQAPAYIRDILDFLYQELRKGTPGTAQAVRSATEIIEALKK